MKLRNKKTGEIIDAGCRTTLTGNFWIIRLNPWGKPIHMNFYESLAELNEEWEDYKPKEPLLKDYPNEMEAIRAYGVAPLTFHRHARKGYSTFNYCTHYICFDRLFENLKDGEAYTIDELCGEKAPEPKEPTFVDLDERIREKDEE